MTRRAVVVLLSLLALLVACGGGDDDTGGASTSSAAIVVEHKYGMTEIPATPERVVSVGFNEQDIILALGVVPVGIRDWYGDQPHAVWPWAVDALGGAEPEVLSATEINVEAVAALRPDLILGVSSGMTEDEYEQLSAIAPTVAQSGDFIDYGMPWQDATLLIGEALGRAGQARQLIDDTEGLFASVRAEHPEWAGRSATVSYAMSETEIGAYGPDDIRGHLLTSLGFEIPQSIVDAAGDLFYSSFSLEQIDLLDNDLLIWIGFDETTEPQIKAHPLRQGLTAFAEGREIFLTELEGGAASFSSPLSLPYLLDTLVPKIEAAVDGDPATVVEGSE